MVGKEDDSDGAGCAGRISEHDDETSALMRRAVVYKIGQRREPCCLVTVTLENGVEPVYIMTQVRIGRPCAAPVAVVDRIIRKSRVTSCFVVCLPVDSSSRLFLS